VYLVGFYYKNMKHWYNRYLKHLKHNNNKKNNARTTMI